MSSTNRSPRPSPSGALAGGAPVAAVSPQPTPPSKAGATLANLMAAPGRVLKRALGAPSSPSAHDDKSESESDDYAARTTTDATTALRDPPTGLLNCGDTCYLNSVVQVLFHTPAFRKSILAYEPPSDSDGSDKEDDDLKRANAEAVACQLQKLFREMCKTNSTWLEPRGLVELLRDSNRYFEFQADGQQDAHEFLRFLLENVETALAASVQTDIGEAFESSSSSSSQKRSRNDGEIAARPKKRPRSVVGVNGASPSKSSPNSFLCEEEVLDGSAESPPSAGRAPGHAVACAHDQDLRNKSVGDSLSIHGAAGPPGSSMSEKGKTRLQHEQLSRFDPNVVRSLFQGESVTRTRCCECETSSMRPESFLDLSVPVRMGYSLSGLFTSMTAGDLLDGTNKYACEFCLTKTEAERRFFLSKIPPVFTIHLKLFQFTAMRAGAKIPVATPCPFRMRFNKWCTAKYAKTAPMYELTAVIVHNGGFSTSGHYYSFVKERESGQWYRCDDATVTVESEEHIESILFSSAKSKKTGYLLFYSMLGEDAEEEEGLE